MKNLKISNRLFINGGGRNRLLQEEAEERAESNQRLAKARVASKLTTQTEVLPAEPDWSLILEIGKL